MINNTAIAIGSGLVARDLNGGLPTNWQDQTTPSIDAEFADALSNFTLSAPTVESGFTVLSLVYKFQASVGHLLAIGDHGLLLDTAADRSLQFVVTNVVVNEITIDRPIDHVFPIATTLGRKTAIDMAVNGWGGAIGNERIFSVRSGATPSDFTRYILNMIHSSSGDDSLFGNLPALARGLVLRIKNGYSETVWTFKTNGDIRRFCFDVTYSDKAGPGVFGTSARMSFAGPEKHGVAHRISGTSVIQWLVQDDLTGLDGLWLVGQGHKTSTIDEPATAGCPILIPVPSGIWTPAAINITSGQISIGKFRPKYLWTYCNTGDPAPAGLSLARGFNMTDMPISSKVPIDVYVYSRLFSGSVIVDR